MPVIIKYPELADEHLREIGRVATAGAWLDMMVEHAIQQLGGIDRDIARCVTTRITTHLRLDILRAVGRARLDDEAQIQRLVAITGHIQQVIGERNEVIHAVWASRFDAEAARAAKGRVQEYSSAGVNTKARGKLVISAKNPEDYEFSKVYNDLVSAANELSQFLSDLFDAGRFSSS